MLLGGRGVHPTERRGTPVRLGARDEGVAGVVGRMRCLQGLCCGLQRIPPASCKTASSTCCASSNAVCSTHMGVAQGGLVRCMTKL